MSYGRAMDIKMAAGDVTPASDGFEPERRFCRQVVAEAVNDLFRLPAPPLRKYKDNLGQTEHSRDTALRFLFGGHATSHFWWMAAGLGLDVEAVRDGLERRWQNERVLDRWHRGRAA